MRTERTKRQARGNSAFRIPHSAFTLVELLVVITIIGILSALLLAGIQRTRVAAARARITAEINQLDTTLKDFKNAVGSFPPNTQVDDNSTANTESPTTPIVESTIQTDLKQFMLKAFPQHREPPQLIDALVGLSATAPGGNPGANQATNLPGGMSAAEALVFWIGGFSDDPKYPISGAGGPSYLLKNGFADNELDQIGDRSWQLGVNVQNLGPRDDNDYFPSTYGRYIVYADPRDTSGNTKRRINMWVLKAPGSIAPYVYFDASRGSGLTSGNDVPAATALHIFTGSDEMQETLDQTKSVYAIKQLSDSVGASLRYQFANKGAFQILHPGFDGEWLMIDPAGAYPHIDPNNANTLIPTETLFPGGPWTAELADTQTNFTNGTLESAQP